MDHQIWRDVSWKCDKLDCLKVNYRKLEVGFIIFDDKCEYCRKTIHEPIVTLVNNTEIPNDP
jgi:hypothetical protein